MQINGKEQPEPVAAPPEGPTPIFKSWVDGSPDHLLPQRPYDAASRPTGPPKQPGGTEGEGRGANGENEIARVMAQHGYDMVQVPESKGSPDFRINGHPEKVDGFSPAKSTSLYNIRDVVEGKVHNQNAPYVIVLIDKSGKSVSELSSYIKTHPVEGLKQLWAVKNGELHIIH